MGTIGEPRGQCDFQDGQPGLAEQVPCLVQSQVAVKPYQAQSHSIAEQALQMARAHVGQSGKLFNRQWVGDMSFHHVHGGHQNWVMQLIPFGSAGFLGVSCLSDSGVDEPIGHLLGQSDSVLRRDQRMHHIEWG